MQTRVRNQIEAILDLVDETREFGMDRKPITNINNEFSSSINKLDPPIKLLSQHCEMKARFAQKNSIIIEF